MGSEVTCTKKNPFYSKDKFDKIRLKAHFTLKGLIKMHTGLSVK